MAPTPLIPQAAHAPGGVPLPRGRGFQERLGAERRGEEQACRCSCFFSRPANLLILDEPTNHLDLASKDVLLGALRDFPGTVIFVSHDRHFISHLATRVLEMKAGAARYFPGDYEYYLAKSAAEDGENPLAAARAAAVQEKSPTVTQVQRQEEKRMKSDLRALEREEEEILAALDELETARRETENTMALPEVYADGQQDAGAGEGARGECPKARRRGQAMGRGGRPHFGAERTPGRPQERYSLSMTGA